MAGRVRGKVPAAVRRLGSRLDAYRRKPGRSRRLPGAMWRSAAKLAGKHGVSRVANELRLNYGDLKRRVQAGEKKNTNTKRAGFAKKFVEVGAGAPLWPTSCTIELEDRTGRRMTVRSGQPAVAEMVEMAKVFWGASA